jgi:hypothetical protein
MNWVEAPAGSVPPRFGTGAADGYRHIDEEAVKTD